MSQSLKGWDVTTVVVMVAVASRSIVNLIIFLLSCRIEER